MELKWEIINAFGAPALSKGQTLVLSFCTCFRPDDQRTKMHHYIFRYACFRVFQYHTINLLWLVWFVASFGSSCLRQLPDHQQPDSPTAALPPQLPDGRRVGRHRVHADARERDGRRRVMRVAGAGAWDAAETERVRMYVSIVMINKLYILISIFIHILYVNEKTR